MMNNILLFLLVVAFQIQARAQFFIGGNLGLVPFSQAVSPIYKMGLGGNFAFSMIKDDYNAIGATLGYYSFRSKYDVTPVPNLLPDTMMYSKKLIVVPIGIIYEHYFTENIVKPYVGLELGYLLYKYSFTYKSDIENAEGYITNGKFYFAPKLGIKVKIAGGLHLGIEAKLDLVFAPVNATNYPDAIDEKAFFIQAPINFGLYYLITD